MSLANFTPDAICRKMGLTGFVADPAFVAERNALRVLLYPVISSEDLHHTLGRC